MGDLRFCICFVLVGVLFCPALSASHLKQYVSAVGDPGMKRDGLRVAFEAWNFCNEVGKEAPNMGSPRAADCFDIAGGRSLVHKVTAEDNKLGVGVPFAGVSSRALNDSDLYAVEKELFLGSKCQVRDAPHSWQFWMVMLKNGNFDTRAGFCPENGRRVGPLKPAPRFPCFGEGCMNQPTFYHERTHFVDGTMDLRGSFNGSYELDSDLKRDGSSSFYQVVWEKKAGFGSWAFSHKLKTSQKYPWLMLYLRADATRGLSGGYHYRTRGMLKTCTADCTSTRKCVILWVRHSFSLNEHSFFEMIRIQFYTDWLSRHNRSVIFRAARIPHFKVRLALNVTQGGGPKSQFYLLDIGSCWKNNGYPCDGDVLTDVTRYSEMIINPQTPAWCSPKNLKSCPPYHVTRNNTKIHRNDTANFPYSAYHYYCGPGNAKYLEKPFSTCDPYSNPQAQELVQILPHPVWAEYGYPSKPGEGWIGDPKKWELDVGGLSSRLYFYQDPHTTPARRIWTSMDVGTEIFISGRDEMAEWTLSEFDVLLAKSAKSK